MRCALVFSMVIALAPPALGSQAIYRCKGKNGEVAFVASPCDEESKPIEMRGAKPDPPVAESKAEQLVAPQNQLTGEARMAAEGNIRLREQRCLTNASDQAWSGVARSVERRRANIRWLENQIDRANNNLAGATWEAGMREQIGSQIEAIAIEEDGARRREAELQRDCRNASDQERRRLDGT